MAGDAWQRKQGPVEIRVMEEAAEVIQAVSKAVRFGWDSRNPLTGLVYDNRNGARNEMSDLVAVWNEMAKKEGLQQYQVVSG